MRGFIFRFGSISLFALGVVLLFSLSPMEERVFSQNPAQYQQIGSVT